MMPQAMLHAATVATAATATVVVVAECGATTVAPLVMVVVMMRTVPVWRSSRHPPAVP